MSTMVSLRSITSFTTRKRFVNRGRFCISVSSERQPLWSSYGAAIETFIVIAPHRRCSTDHQRKARCEQHEGKSSLMQIKRVFDIPAKDTGVSVTPEFSIADDDF
jgi:hypothetical protein